MLPCRWESVTLPLGRLQVGLLEAHIYAGNQSPFPLVDFEVEHEYVSSGWESVTLPLGRLQDHTPQRHKVLGISHPSPW